MRHNITLILTLVILILSSYFLQGSPYFLSVIFAILFLYLCILILGSSFIQLNYFVPNINKGNNNGVTFTFDDGPDPEFTPKILDVLAKENVKATFFVIGNKIEKNKDLLLRIHNEGHIIGNHSFSHTKNLTILSSTNLKKDIEKCSNSIEKIIHRKPLFFRPPFGITTPNYLRATKHLKMKSIGWSIRSLDTVAKDKETLYKKVVRKISNSSIVLFHDTQKITLDVLPDIIHFCKENGINIVSLPESINKKAYE